MWIFCVGPHPWVPKVSPLYVAGGSRLLCQPPHWAMSPRLIHVRGLSLCGPRMWHWVWWWIWNQWIVGWTNECIKKESLGSSKRTIGYRVCFMPAFTPSVSAMWTVFPMKPCLRSAFLFSEPSVAPSFFSIKSKCLSLAHLWGLHASQDGLLAALQTHLLTLPLHLYPWVLVPEHPSSDSIELRA